MIGQLYNDTVDVYRSISKDDGHGGTVEEMKLIHSGLSCRLSQKTLSNTVNEEVRSSIQSFKLFTEAGIDIQQNDMLYVFRGGKLKDKYTFLAAKPFNYYDLIPHAEIVLEEVIEGERD